MCIVRNLFKYSFLLYFLTFGIVSQAQISQGGIPYSFQHEVLKDNVPVQHLPFVDNQTLLTEETAQISRETFVFGKEFEVDYNLLNAGVWTDLANGDRLWRLGISSENAYSLNLIFNKFYLPETAELFIYTKDKSYVLGAFTAKNNIPERVFSTTLLPGDEIVIEYYEPKEVKGQGLIHLSTIVHGYKDFFFKGGVYGSSGSCNININCEEGNNYQTVKRAVALILNGSYAHCSGTLINNTNNDGTPYFITARHCLNNKSPLNFVFIFGYETANCNGTNGSSGHSINAATLVADGTNSDFALLKLSSAPPLSYNPYYVGWNRLNVPSIFTACIHQPSGDYKKISICTTTLESSSYNEYPTNTHWEVPSWSKGTTEGGSSGAAIFNQHLQFVGQLEGGTASCSNPLGYDLFGKLSYSWLNENNTSASKRLKDWLDPLNTNVDYVDGYDPCLPSYTIDAALQNINYPTSSVCQYIVEPKITLFNNGSDTLTEVKVYYQINQNVPELYEWAGLITFSQSEQLTLPGLDIEDGNYNLKIWVSNPNQSTDENPDNDTLSVDFIYNKGISFSWDIKTDILPEQTTWVLKTDEGNVIAQNPSELMGLSFYVDTFCLDTGCYDFVIYDSNGDGLNGNGGYGQGYCYVSLNNQIIMSSIQFEYKDSIRFCIDESTSIQTMKQTPASPKVKLFPNPSNNTTHISLTNVNDNETYKARMYTIEGKFVKEITLVHGDNSLDVSNLHNGIYIIRIQNNTYTSTHKLIIQK
ncbi:MAG: T9SS type A sorting domain-containing protein [Bacteroidales bacterium]|nr:T9SS type A sorting domain-containing protein [Bacteroidales bacterium]